MKYNLLWLLLGVVLLMLIGGGYVLRREPAVTLPSPALAADHAEDLSSAHVETLAEPGEPPIARQQSGHESPPSAIAHAKELPPSDNRFSYWTLDGRVSDRFAAKLDLTVSEIEALNKLREGVAEKLVQLDIEHSTVSTLENGALQIQVGRYPEVGSRVFDEFNNRLREILGEERFARYQSGEPMAFAKEIPNIGLLRKTITISRIFEGQETFYEVEVERFGTITDPVSNTSDETLVYRAESERARFDQLDHFASILREIIGNSQSQG